ncbi:MULTISPECIES: phage portal protein [unclassified Mycobacterium]|uniref:phage portal protein n=1 Tax=unclassified Mycobacterium TaxID=2642494 RepID=UPI0007FD0C03|nr:MULTISPECIES: phage portal protein [unclassified Mycobacterium]OBG71335.1 phage portal protein [Mycobacterium sp. E1214]OBH28703.1 phage portal protein [Mycobacterium sp. E1319]
MILANGGFSPIAPQAFAETAPMFYSSYFVPRTGLELETRFATYGEMYRVQPMINAVVNKLANNIARLNMFVWDEASPTGKVLDQDSPYAKLIANPCPTMDTYSFLRWTWATRLIYGEAYWIKLREGRGNQITGFVPMHPAMTQIHRESDGSLRYRFMGQPNEEIREEDVVPFREYNPDDTMRGLSRLEALRSTLMNEDSSRRATASWWKRMGRPSFALKLDGKLDPKGKERLRQQFEQQYSGSTNVGGVMVLENGTEVTPLQLTAEEMQYIESRRFNREEVCTVFDMPPAALQIMDHATFSNITENMRSVYRDTMAPHIEEFESALDTHVGSEFNGDKYARFAVDSVLRGDFEKRALAHAQLVMAGIEKPAEARPSFDLDDAGPIADKLYANSAIQPLGHPAMAERLTIAGQIGQPTPADQYPIVVPPATPGGSATPVPRLVPGLPASEPSPKALKYIRDIGGHIGGGKSIQEAVRVLLDKYPADEEAIREACGLIIERTV